MIVFFFKQKTAYDMRISDWSSDVCSSDLGFCLLLGACDESACDTSTRTAIKLKFYSRTTDSIPRDTVVERDLEGIYGIGREDSVLYEGALLSVVTMPLPLEGDYSRFVLEFPTTNATQRPTFQRPRRDI